MTLIRHILAGFLPAFLFFSPFVKAQQPDDPGAVQDPMAGFSIEKLETNIRYAADGTGERESTAKFRLTSEAAVRALGVLTFSFNSENEQLAVDYVRVVKPGGNVVETPQSSVLDAASAVTSAAPMYSDLREKQIPVRALAAGDTLEYKVRWTEAKPMIPNQFWYEHDFAKGTEVTEETLTVRVPAGKYIKVSSPDVTPQISEQNGEKVYLWKTSHHVEAEPERPTLKHDDNKASDKKAESGKATDKKTEAKKTDDAGKHSLELTTFQSWEEVGRWYAQISAEKVAVTPQIQAKSDELTKGMASDEAKTRALYDYVSTKFRYISVSFGEGRYQPHSASEVLANLYGDCKDKHTLLASLLKAAGIDASAVLIGSELPFNPDIPSPVQFNHVITMVRQNGHDLWLDTTPEIAPFGQLEKPLRDHKALLVATTEAPRVVTTPAVGVVPNLETAQFSGELDAQGTVKGHLDFTVRGDDELLMRAFFHETPPAQWKDLAQKLSEGMGYGGTVSAVDVDNPQDTSKAFHIGWDYKREKYGDWANLRIPPPLPVIGIPDPGDDPAADILIGGPSEVRYQSTLKLPEGYSLDIPGAVHQTIKFAEYEGVSSVSNSVLETRRTLIVRQDKVVAGQRAEVKNFADAVNRNIAEFIVLAKAGAGANTVVSENNPRAEELIEQAIASLQRRDVNSARDSLHQAELLNPKQRNLWAGYAMLYEATNDRDKVLDSLRKEVQLHPGEPQMYRALGQAELAYGHSAEAATAYRDLLRILPDDPQASKALAGVLFRDKQYDEAVGTLEKARKASPDDLEIETLRIQALLESGRKPEGLSAAREFGARAATPNDLNSVAWELADTGTDLKLARQYADKSISILEDSLKDLRLSDLRQDKLREIYTLAMVWDTAGWTDYLEGNVPKAEREIEAAWKLSQHGAVADHLAQIYEKQGRRDQAIRLLQLSVATGDKSEGAFDRLKKLDPAKAGTVTPEELGKLRTVNIPDFSRPKGTAEFFVLLSARGPEDVTFVSGADDLRGARDAIFKAKFDAPFADDGPEKIARRGILSCSQYTEPACQFVLLLPGNTTAP